jgi:hypothetical protein
LGVQHQQVQGDVAGLEAVFHGCYFVKFLNPSIGIKKEPFYFVIGQRQHTTFSISATEYHNMLDFVLVLIQS